MNAGREGQWEEQRDAAGSETDPRPSSRRRLLGGAAGGLVLAASGLFVPEWLEEAEADNLPVRRVQQRKEQKRRKRGHDHRGRRRAEGKKRGNVELYRDVAIYVYNTRYYGSVQVQGWVGRSAYNNQMDPYYMPNKDWDWATLSSAGQSSGPTPEPSLATTTPWPYGSAPTSLFGDGTIGLVGRRQRFSPVGGMPMVGTRWGSRWLGRKWRSIAPSPRGGSRSSATTTRRGTLCSRST